MATKVSINSNISKTLMLTTATTVSNSSHSSPQITVFKAFQHLRPRINLSSTTITNSNLRSKDSSQAQRHRRFFLSINNSRHFTGVVLQGDLSRLLTSAGFSNRQHLSNRHRLTSTKVEQERNIIEVNFKFINCLYHQSKNLSRTSLFSSRFFFAFTLL